jgi:hypothetical protein
MLLLKRNRQRLQCNCFKCFVVLKVKYYIEKEINELVFFYNAATSKACVENAQLRENQCIAPRPPW